LTDKEKAMLKDIEDLVVLFHGDLGADDRIRSMLKSCRIENTPWRRKQFIIFVIGLFHLKMACADTMWRIFIMPLASQEDTTGLYKLLSQIRPRERSKFKLKTGPGFRRMHKTVQHIGIVSRLQSWRVHILQKQPEVNTLEAFAATKPSWQQLVKYATDLCQTHVTSGTFRKLRMSNDAARNKQRENMLLRDKYFALYEEISHAMNTGDIGRVEACMLPWAGIFKGCGKHKYAIRLVRWLYDLYYVYPERLR
jgi:hypothetical protein